MIKKIMMTSISSNSPSLLYIFLQTRANSKSNSRHLLCISIVQLLYTTLKEKGGNPYLKPYPLPYSLRNSYRNLKSENFQDYAQKPQRNCTFMNSASGTGPPNKEV